MAAEGYMNTVYRGPEGESTQWEDIHRKLGNLPEKEPVWKPDKFTPEQEDPKDKVWLDKKGEDELEDLEDEFDDQRFLEEYRQKRIAEIQTAAKRPRFGSVEDIRGSEFIQKVTNAGPDIYVVVHLYKDGHAGSAIMGDCIKALSEKYTGTKFLRIISTDCIPNYPDQNLPTVLLYHDGNIIKNMVGLGALGGPKTTPEQVALIFNTFGKFCLEGDDAEAEEEAQVRSLVQRLVEQRVEEAGHQDESSDFDD